MAQSLSTFSGHLRSIVRIVDAAGPGCLVLLDELGAGTDPTEGSALAQALLDHFIRAGALVVATTHYAELKTYAHNTPLARNASVEFDLETLSPTYRLTIGLPGTSQAFAIAERLGLPAELVTEARSRLSRAQQEFESTLASIKASQQTIAEAEARAADADARAAEARHLAEEERRRARRERQEATVAARSEVEAAVAAVHEEIEAARRLLARETLTETRLEEQMRRLEERLTAISGRVAEQLEEPASEDVPAWRVGMRAATSGGFEGTISELEPARGRATLQVGGIKAVVDVADLHAPPERTTSGGAPVARRKGRGRDRPQRSARTNLQRPTGEFAAPTARAATEAAVRSRGPAPRAIPSSLDLRGARVDEAVELLDRYIDRAAVAGANRVTIIHGHGSGALRDVVRDQLSGHPLVREWRPGERGEGGDGATVVTL